MTHEAGRFEEKDLFDALEACYGQWQFAERSDDQNFAFAHTLASATLELFPYLEVAGSEEFGGEEAPDSIKPLVSHIWKVEEGVVVYHQGLGVNMKRRGEDEQIAPYIPGFSELLKSGKTFEEMVGTIAADAEIQRGIRPGYTIKDEAIIVSFSTNTRMRGIEFISLPDRIELAIYGRAGETRDFSRYAATYNNKPRVLAETVANLALLGAKHCLWMNNPKSPDYLVSLGESSRELLDGFL